MIKKKLEVIDKDHILRIFILHHKSVLLRKYRKEQLKFQQCNCFDVARAAINKDNYGKTYDLFKPFLNMCKQVTNCTANVNFKHLILKKVKLEKTDVELNKKHYGMNRLKKEKQKMEK